jgi:hypothetical protein
MRALSAEEPASPADAPVDAAMAFWRIVPIKARQPVREVFDEARAPMTPDVD